MNFLLDTCTFLWILGDDERLSATARDSFRDPSNEVFLSSVSVWEIMVKHALGRLPLPAPPERYLPEMRARHGITALPLDEVAACYLGRLPVLHQDPFDRMLVCQALARGLILLTPDEQLHRYPVAVLW